MGGKAISFAMPDQGSKVREIERLTRIYLPISKLPELPQLQPAQSQQSYTPNNFNRSNYSSNRNRPGGNSSHGHGSRKPASRFGYAKKRY
jgi:hypothetical protein